MGPAADWECCLDRFPAALNQFEAIFRTLPADTESSRIRCKLKPLFKDNVTRVDTALHPVQGGSVVRPPFMIAQLPR